MFSQGRRYNTNKYLTVTLWGRGKMLYDPILGGTKCFDSNSCRKIVLEKRFSQQYTYLFLPSQTRTRRPHASALRSLQIRSAVHTPTSSAPSRHIRIRIPQSIRPIARMTATARRTKPISRARELRRSPSPTAVRTRRSAKPGIASVVLHVSHTEIRGAFGGVVDVVLQGVAVAVLGVAESGALGKAAGDDRKGEYHADDGRCDGVCGGFTQAFGPGVDSHV